MSLGVIAVFVLVGYCVSKWYFSENRLLRFIRTPKGRYFSRIIFLVAITAAGIYYEEVYKSLGSGIVIGVVSGLIIDTMNEMSKIRMEAHENNGGSRKE